jgi:hypothetical protein
MSAGNYTHWRSHETVQHLPPIGLVWQWFWVIPRMIRFTLHAFKFWPRELQLATSHFLLEIGVINLSWKWHHSFGCPHLLRVYGASLHVPCRHGILIVL